MIKAIYLIFGFLSVLTGIIGIVLPLLPTTPFLLLAAFCFSKSSERLHQALLNHPWCGKIIDNWERYGVIPLPAKLLSTSMMVGMTGFTFIVREPEPLVSLITVSLILVGLLYIWSKPSVPQRA